MLHPLCFSRFCSEGILERGDTKFLQRYKVHFFFYLFLFSHVAPHLWNCRLDGDRFQATSDKPGRPSDDVVRRRDSNYNCSETEDAHISR
jgi:hypothetical protein